MVSNRERSGREIIQLLYDEGLIETWYRGNPEGYRLVSGIWSPFYINMRLVGSKKNSQKILNVIGIGMGELIKREMPHITRIVGLYIAGIPLASAVTMSVGIPSCYARNMEGIKTEEAFHSELPSIKKKLHEYGHHSLVEGDFCEGDKIAIIDDLVTKFDTKLVARAQINEAAREKGANVACKDVVVLIDREQGAQNVAVSHGMTLRSLIKFKTEGIGWLKDRMAPKEYETVVDYLANEQKYQNPLVQEELRKVAIRK